MYLHNYKYSTADNPSKEIQISKYLRSSSEEEVAEVYDDILLQKQLTGSKEEIIVSQSDSFNLEDEEQKEQNNYLCDDT